ncbi:MAG TPA: hypothetical protein VJ898_04595 [Natrialbaceae archaeon]|nr:hypothetical protein [Natrialbaceae archaeon]
MADLEANRELAREYVTEGLFEGDEEVLEKLVNRGYAGHVGNWAFDREDLMTLIAPDVAATASFLDEPDLVVHHVVAEGDRVAVVTTITEGGVPAFDLTVVVRIEDGDLVKAWHYGAELFATFVDEEESLDDWSEGDLDDTMGSGSIEWPIPPDDPRTKD